MSISRARFPLTESRPGIVRYLVAPAREGDRLDRVLAELTGLSRRRARLIVEQGDIWLNGRPCRVLSRTVRMGDVVDAMPSGEPLRDPEPIPAVDILLDDGWLVAAAKPAGAHSQPPRRREGDQLSFWEQCVLCLSARHGHRVELGLFHRLDRITSGVLVFSRNRQASRGLARAWRTGDAAKRYLTVVVGDPGAARRTVRDPIAADPLVAGRFRVDPRGREARTDFRRIALLGELALVEALPLTGRTHQVRVHLQHVGHPVAGDHLYGGGEDAPRPYLHSWRLTLPHPNGQTRLTIEAPLPPDMEAFLAGLGWDRALPKEG